MSGQDPTKNRSHQAITEEAIDELRQRIGEKISPQPDPWNYEATRDTIRHFAHGAGDDNPLWCDPDYAKGTRHGDLIAPPSFLFSCSRVVSGWLGGLPGVHAMYGGTEFIFHKTVRRGDVIDTEGWLSDVDERDTKFAGRSIIQTYSVNFTNQDGDRVAEGKSWFFRTDRDAARRRNEKYGDIEKMRQRVYTDEELSKVYKLYDAEEIRGAEPLYWEDVSEGDKLPRMAKGPMTVSGFIAFTQGWGGIYVRANKVAYKMMRKHPALGIKNRFGIPDNPERVHWETDLALEVGAPGAFDYGPERGAWFMHQLTNWMGDDATLAFHTYRIRRHNPEGDLLFIDAEVTRKYEENGRKMVEIEQVARNQDDELSAYATGRVELPARG
ncbi:MAG: FAS1-like dehydratase domain-containing protein [Alphaproteobacteria bacterium]